MVPNVIILEKIDRAKTKLVCTKYVSDTGKHTQPRTKTSAAKTFIGTAKKDFSVTGEVNPQWFPRVTQSWVKIIDESFHIRWLLLQVHVCAKLIFMVNYVKRTQIKSCQRQRKSYPLPNIRLARTATTIQGTSPVMFRKGYNTFQF